MFSNEKVGDEQELEEGSQEKPPEGGCYRFLYEGANLLHCNYSRLQEYVLGKKTGRLNLLQYVYVSESSDDKNKISRKK